MSLCDFEEIFKCIWIFWILIRMHNFRKLSISFFHLLNRCILINSKKLMWNKSFQWLQILHEQPTFEKQNPSENDDSCLNNKPLVNEIPSMNAFSFCESFLAIVALTILKVVSVNSNFSKEKRP